MAEAASYDDMSDTIDQLFPAIRECPTLAEFSDAALLHPAALDGADAATVAANICGYGPNGVATTPLCRSLVVTRQSLPLPPGVTLIEDPQRDVEGPAYADVVEVSARTKADSLLLSMRLRGAVRSLADGEQLVYTFALDADRDDNPDWWVSFETQEGTFYPVLFEIAQPLSQTGIAYPGTASMDGKTVSMSVDADALGLVGLPAVNGQAEWYRGAQESRDVAPNDESFERLAK